MKKILALPCLLVLALLLSVPALASEWTPVNDELDIDYQTHTLRIYVTGKSGYDLYPMARKMTMEYIATLTDGANHIKLADVFKTRKAMASKTLTLVTKNIRSDASSNLDDGLQSIYFLFDLNLLKSLFPEINMPTP